jgi:predicted HAD superfamily Cof-like phosphohydrolase
MSFMQNVSVSMKLARFHAALSLKTPEPLHSSATGYNLLSLRQDLIEEEALEVRDALDDLMSGAHPYEDKAVRAHVLKELCDLVYVAVGTAEALEMDFDTAFTRVHNNNMLKLENTELREDGKLLKPQDHPKVDLEDLV